MYPSHLLVLKAAVKMGRSLLMWIWFCLGVGGKQGRDAAHRSVYTQQWQAKSRGITETRDDLLQSAGTAGKVLRSERLQIYVLVTLLIEQNTGYRRKYDVIMDIWCVVGVCECGWTCYSSAPNSGTGSCWDCRPRPYPFHHTHADRMKSMEPVRVFLSVRGQPMWLRSVPQNKWTLIAHSHRENVPIRHLGCINSTSGCSHMHTHVHMCGKMGWWWGGAWKQQ